jgi:hypothetical protein
LHQVGLFDPPLLFGVYVNCLKLFDIFGSESVPYIDCLVKALLCCRRNPQAFRLAFVLPGVGSPCQFRLAIVLPGVGSPCQFRLAVVLLVWEPPASCP